MGVMTEVEEEPETEVPLQHDKPSGDPAPPAAIATEEIILKLDTGDRIEGER